MIASEERAPSARAIRPPEHRTARAESLSWRVRQALSLSLLANHFPELHGLRVVAILGVLQFHVTTMFLDGGVALNDDWIKLTMTVFFGMDLFFVMSGFLIGTMILHAIDAEKKQRPMRFYARRSFRIFPLYYVVLTALVVIGPMNPTQKLNLWKEYAYLTNTVKPLERTTVMMIYGWSLCVEEQFYLVAPLLVAMLARLRGHAVRLTMLGALWLSATLVRLWIVAHPSEPWTDGLMFQAMYVRTHTRFDTVIAGVLLAYLNFHFAKDFKLMFEEARWRRLFGGAALLCLWLLLFPTALGQPAYFYVRALCFGTLTSIMYVAYVLLLLHGEGWGKRFLSAPIFLQLATLGYGVYLVHMPLFDALILPFSKWMLTRVGMSMAVIWPISLLSLWLVAVLVAYVLHLLIEKPALMLRDRFAP